MIKSCGRETLSKLFWGPSRKVLSKLFGALDKGGCQGASEVWVVKVVRWRSLISCAKFDDLLDISAKT